MAARLEAEKNALAEQLESGSKEVAERMQKEEEQRKREADELKVTMLRDVQKYKLFTFIA